MPRSRPLFLTALLGVATSLALMGCASRASEPATSDAERQATRQARLAELLPMPAAERIQIVDREWVDDTRARTVPVRLVLPRDATGPVPLVLVSHGIGGSRLGYSYLGRHLAAQGYAALHVQHVGSDNRLWRGSPFDLLSRLNGAATEAEAIARAQDLRFALDRALADADIATRVDPARIAAVGHSYGGNTVLLAAGARVPGKPVLVDDRLKAVVAISAPPFHGMGDPAPILEPLRVPALHVTAEDDDIRIPGFYSGVQERVALFRATGSEHKRLVVFRDGSHSMFTDRLGTGGSDHNVAVKLATRELVVDFLDGLWRERADAVDGWQTRHAALLSPLQAEGAPTHVTQRSIGR
ncbi:MAG: acetylhydrolase [Hydrogenophaga sp.]|nr:acetylhydrolase [Hydrogenophaga sp.]